jgi:hypothetical protein
MEHGAERFRVQPVEYFTVRFTRTVIDNYDAFESAGSKFVHITDQPLFRFI